MNEPVMLGRARRMRKDATDADRKVWSLVRNRRLDGYRLSAPSSNRRLLLLPI
jgi:very-short-patch-repair endonuclease